MVTSWFWLVGIVVLSLLPPLIKTADRRRRGHRHRLSGDVLGRGRHRLGAGGADRARPHRAATPRSPARCCSGCSRSISASRIWRAAPDIAVQGPRQVFCSGARPARRVRSRRPGDRRRAVHRAGLRRGAGLGRRRLSRAHHRRGQRAQRRLHDRRDGCCRAAAEVPASTVPVLFLAIGVASACGRAWRSGGRMPRRLKTSSASSARGRPSRRRRRDNSPGRSASPAPCGRRACAISLSSASKSISGRPVFTTSRQMS